MLSSPDGALAFPSGAVEGDVLADLVGAADAQVGLLAAVLAVLGGSPSTTPALRWQSGPTVVHFLTTAYGPTTQRSPMTASASMMVKG